MKTVALIVVSVVIGAAAVLAVEIVRDAPIAERGHPALTVPDKNLPYLAQATRTQLYRSGDKGDAALYRVVDMPRENLRCVMLIGNGMFGRAVSCQPLTILEGR